MTEHASQTMTDATLPPLPSPSDEETSNTLGELLKDGSQDESSFLSTSQDSVTAMESNLETGQKKDEKKRKRTSPEDQVILEAEYRANPKPDKAARLEIVKKVSLGEKAVQIWFQNRRQNTRRKSRPLLPHEIAAFGLGGMAALSSDPVANFGSSQGSAFYPSSSQSEHQGYESANLHLTQSMDPDIFNTGSAPQPESEAAATPSKLTHDSPPPLDPRAEPSSFSLSQPSSQPLPPTSAMAPGYLANRRSASSGYFGTPTAVERPVYDTPNASAPTQPSSCPEKLSTPDNNTTPSSSQVRLSMSLDGKASLVPTELTSSPPRPQAAVLSLSQSAGPPRRRIGMLQRSRSALPYGNRPIPRPNLSSLAKPGEPSLPTVRSRDAHSWEFRFDLEVRDELTTQAENESSGSAIAAISLLRSSSNSVLKVNMNKRNSPVVNHSREDGNVKSVKRAKLGRAQSSLARLQGTAKLALDSSSAKRKGGELLRSPGGDSDKENWVPAEGGGHRRQNRVVDAERRIHRQGRRKVLGGGEDSLTGKEKGAGSKIFEDDTATERVDAEVERFMRGEVSPSKKGDLDCIQGLLSLSQGNWR